jgi:hypothetical protein
MNSKIIYDKLMKRAIGRVYIKGLHERHHIIPKSMGGSNKKENIVCLTYKEHFLAHWLLTKFAEGKDKIKMLHALAMMSNKNSLGNKNKRNSKRIISAWQYEVSASARSKSMMDKKIALGHKKTYESNQKHSKKMKEFYLTLEGKEIIEKRKINMIGNKIAKGGHSHTEDTKIKLRGKNHWRSIPIRCINDQREFFGAGDASRFYKLSVGKIRSVLNGKREQTTCGLKFEYIIKMAQAA